MREGTPRHADGPTSVYRYYDQWGVLIYVGITGRGTRRNREHNRDKDWWPFVARQEVDHLPDRPSALDAEAALIAKHEPPFNTQKNRRPALVRANYLALRDRLIGGETDIKLLMCNRNGKIPLTRVPEGFVMAPELWPILDRVEIRPPHKRTRVVLGSGVRVGQVIRFRRSGPFGIFEAQCNPLADEGDPFGRFRMITRKDRDGGPFFIFDRVVIV